MFRSGRSGVKTDRSPVSNRKLLMVSDSGLWTPGAIEKENRMTERKESVEIWQLVARGIFVLAALYCIRRYEAGWFSLPAISVWNVCLAVGIWLLVGELFRASKRLKIYSIIGGAVLAIAMVAGRGISDTDAIGVLIHPLRNCLLSLCSVLVFTVLLAAFACLLIRAVHAKTFLRPDSLNRGTA